MIYSNKNSMPYDILRTTIRTESFVKLLSEERKRQKISQKELGRLVGLEGKCISAIENGNPPVFSLIVAITMSRIRARTYFALSLVVSNIPRLRNERKSNKPNCVVLLPKFFDLCG